MEHQWTLILSELSKIKKNVKETFPLFTSSVLPKCQYLKKPVIDFRQIGSELYANGALSNLCDMAAITENSK